MIYHVAPAHHTGHLYSLHQLHGDDAYEMYADRWPEAGFQLTQYHVHYVHCYDSLGAAREHAEQFGGKIYAIDTEFLDVERDALEFDHPIIRNLIEADCIEEVA